MAKSFPVFTLAANAPAAFTEATVWAVTPLPTASRSDANRYAGGTARDKLSLPLPDAPSLRLAVYSFCGQGDLLLILFSRVGNFVEQLLLGMHPDLRYTVLV